ncbi:hypothetical protein SH501x_001324 [Pirellulaceae bacterium SH501]
MNMQTTNTNTSMKALTKSIHHATTPHVPIRKIAMPTKIHHRRLAMVLMIAMNPNVALQLHRHRTTLKAICLPRFRSITATL